MRIRVNNKARIAFVALLLMLLTALTPAVPGYANLSGSTFEGSDGNTIVNTIGNTDWSNAPNLSVGVDLASGSGDNAFGQGTKENTLVPTIVFGSIPPNKNDLTQFRVASEFTGGHNYVYLAWNRLVNIGSADLDFEINQNGTPDGNGVTPERTAGDVLILYNFGGSGTPSLYIARWLSSGVWSNPVALTGDSEAGVSADGLFGEASVDLTAAGVFTSNVCQHFGSAYTKARSSNSFTAEMKDFIAPIGVNITNCGTGTVRKVDQHGSLIQGAHFTLTGPNGTSPLTETSTGTFPAANLSLNTPYTVTETQAPPGYAVSPPVSQTFQVNAINSTQTVTFTDISLSNIYISFHANVAGATLGTLQCDTDPQPVNMTDGVPISYTNLTPGTYHCTVVINPS